VVLLAALGSCSNGDDAAEEAPATTTTAAELVGCPFPGKLPFATQSTAFVSPDSTQLAVDHPHAVYDSEDVMGNPGVAQVLTGAMKRATSPLLIQAPMQEEFVSLWAHDGASSWRQLGRVQTDDTAKFSFDIGASPFGQGASRAFSILEGDGSCAVHGVFQWPAGTEVILTDIDATLTLADDEFTRQAANEPNYVPQLMPHGDDVMKAWGAKGYKIVYLTARPGSLRGPTRAWLEAKGFPFGPLITGTSLSLSDEATRAYKGDHARQLIQTFGWKVIAAYGNAITDYEAYEDAGIAKDVTFIVGPLAGMGGTVAIANMDYSDHLATYVATQPDATQP
jgi:hypothetical protein